MCPEVSIVIPVFNAEKYIKRTISTITNQNFKNIEIIVVNDGSSDNSLDIITILSKNDQRIRIFSQKNSGVSAARNKGIQEAQGNYIMFMDADDIMVKDSLESLVNSAKETDADISIGDIKIIKNYNSDYKMISESDTNIINFSRTEVLESFFRDNAQFNCYSACAKLYSKKIYQKLKFVEKRNSNEDRFYFFQALCISNIITYVNKCVYLYEKHEQSLSTSQVNSRIFDNLYFSDKMLEYVEKNENSLIDSAKYNQFITYMMVYRNFYRDKKALKKYTKELLEIRKFLLEFEKLKIGSQKRVEYLIIKYFNCCYYYIVKIFDKLKQE